MPEELEEAQLTDDANDLRGLIGDEYPMHSASKRLHGLIQGSLSWKRDELLLPEY